MYKPEYKNIEGWTPFEKVVRLKGLIKAIDAQNICEIGVYGGSSLIPMADACREKGGGMCVGIDPWEPEASKEGFDEGDANRKWWGDLDHSWVYGLYCQKAHEFGVRDHITVYKAYSHDVCHMFADNQFDILHIDGNHSELCSTRDVELYLPKVRKGGYIVFDDTDWPSTKKTQEMLDQHCQLLEHYGKWAIWAV